MTEQDGEFTPRERGLMIGYGYGEAFAGDPFDLKPLVEERDPDAYPSGVVSIVQTRLSKSGNEALENDLLFWSGFRGGVASWLVDQGITRDTPRPQS